MMPTTPVLLLVFLPDLGGRDAQSFLEVVEDTLDALAAGPRAADVGVVHDVDDEADQRPSWKAGWVTKKSGKWPEPRSGSFRRIGVARPQRLDRMRGQRVAHRGRHGAHVARRVRPLRHHPALGIEDGHREVLALARLLGVRGLVHGGADLDRDGLQRAPDDAERDRDRARSWRRPRLDDQVGVLVDRSATAPGGSTEVDSRSSTIAGPASGMPAGELVAIVHRAVDPAAGLGEVRAPASLERRRTGRAAALGSAIARGAADGRELPGHDLDRLAPAARSRSGRRRSRRTPRARARAPAVSSRPCGTGTVSS